MCRLFDSIEFRTICSVAMSKTNSKNNCFGEPFERVLVAALLAALLADLLADLLVLSLVVLSVPTFSGGRCLMMQVDSII